MRRKYLLKGSKDVVEKQNLSVGVHSTSQSHARLLATRQRQTCWYSQTSSFANRDYLLTLLANLRLVASLEQRKVTLEAALVQDLLVPLLIERRAKDDVIPNGLILHP